MARKPNYGFEKRQRELLKKANKEEKRKRKIEESDQPSEQQSPEQE